MKSISKAFAFLALIAIAASGSAVFGAVTNVSSVGILDPNPNNLTIVDAASNTAGGVTLSSFNSLITSAYSNNTGGVFDFQELYQGGSWPNNNNGANNGALVGNGAANPVVGSYGTAHSKTMSFYRLEGDTIGAVDGIDANTNQGTNVISGGWDSSSGSGTGLVNFANNTAVIDGTGVTAGGGYMGIAGDGTPCTFVFTSNPLSAFGITGLPRGASRHTQIIFTLSNNSTFTTTNELITTSAVFYGYQAPSGLSIVKAEFDNPDGPNRFDDLAFIVAAPVLKPGDVNGDGHFDAKDILAMQQALGNLPYFQTHYGPGNTTLDNASLLTVLDQNNDGLINNADMQKLLINLKNGLGSTAAVPEPATGLLMTIGSILLLRHRRRSSFV